MELIIKDIPKIGIQKIPYLNESVSWNIVRKCVNAEYSDKVMNKVHLSNKLNQRHYIEFITDGFISFYGLRMMNKKLYEFFNINSKVIEQILTSVPEEVPEEAVFEKAETPKKKRKREKISLVSDEYHEFYDKILACYPDIDLILKSRLNKTNHVIDDIVPLLTENSSDFSKNLFRQHYKLSGRSISHKGIHTTLRINLNRNFQLYRLLYVETSVSESGVSVSDSETSVIVSFPELFHLLYEIVYLDFIRLMNNEISIIKIISTFYMINTRSNTRATYLREMKSICVAMNSLLRNRLITDSQLTFFDSTKEWSYREIGITTRIRNYAKNLLNRSIDHSKLFGQLMTAYETYGNALQKGTIIHQNSLIEKQYLMSLMKVSFVCELGAKRIGEFQNSNVIYIPTSPVTEIYDRKSLLRYLDREESLFTMLKLSPLEGFSTFFVLLGLDGTPLEIVFYWNIAKGHDSTNMMINRVVVYTSAAEHAELGSEAETPIVLPKRIGVIFKNFIHTYTPTGRLFSSNSEQLILSYDNYYPTFQELRTIVSNACIEMSKDIMKDEEGKKIISKILSHHDPLFNILHQTQMNLERHTLSVFNKYYNDQTLSSIEEKLFLQLTWKMIENCSHSAKSVLL